MCTFLLKHFKFTVILPFHVVSLLVQISRKIFYSQKIIEYLYAYLNGHRRVIGYIYNPCRNSPSALRYLDTLGYRVLALLPISWGVDKTGRDVRYHFANDKVRTSAGNGVVDGNHECMRVHMYNQFGDTQSLTPGIYRPIASLRRVTYGVSRREGSLILRKMRQYHDSIAARVQRLLSRQIFLQCIKFWIKSKI